MVRYFTHINIDKDKWDIAIDKSANGLIYAKSWYLDIVSPGWEALTDENYKTILPLTWREKIGIKYLYPPFFTQQLGVFSEQIIGSDTVLHFLALIPPDFRYVEIQLNHQNKFSSADFEISERLTHHLNFNHSYAEIATGYSDNLKRNLKKAGQNNLQVIQDFNVNELINLFRAGKGKEVKTLKTSDYDTLRALLSECEKRNLLTRLGVRINNELAAGVLFLKSNHEYILIFSAVNDVARETGAMNFLIDHFIQSHQNENMKLDFEGSMDKNLARFYKSFGADEVVYLQIKRNRLPFYLRWLKN
jgi:hypothetical protein